MKDSELPALFLLLKDISGFDAEYAVYAMGDSPLLYEETLRQMFRLIPAHISQMEQYLADNNGLNSFKVKVHSLKSSLRQIGCSTLPEIASRLEKKAKQGDRQKCIELFNYFKEELVRFHKQIGEALQTSADSNNVAKAKFQETYSGSINDLLDVVLQAKTAAEDFDSIVAAEILTPLAKYNFSKDTNELLTKALEELAVFQSKKALDHIKNLELSLRKQ